VIEVFAVCTAATYGLKKVMDERLEALAVTGVNGLLNGNRDRLRNDTIELLQDLLVVDKGDLFIRKCEFADGIDTKRRIYVNGI